MDSPRLTTKPTTTGDDPPQYGVMKHIKSLVPQINMGGSDAYEVGLIGLLPAHDGRPDVPPSR